MHEVIIICKFLTGTTISDRDEAERVCREMFWREMEKLGVKENEHTGQQLFDVQVVDVFTERLK